MHIAFTLPLTPSGNLEFSIDLNTHVFWPWETTGVSIENQSWENMQTQCRNGLSLTLELHILHYGSVHNVIGAAALL